jgi:hypothetical protein
MANLVNKIPKVCQDVADMLEVCKEYKRKREPELNLNLCYYRGDQWSQYDLSTGLITRNQTVKPKRYTMNVIQPLVDTVIGQITSAIPRLMVQPNTYDTADLYSADIANTILDSEVWRGLNMRQNLLRILPLMATFGTIVLHPYFNASKGLKVSKEEVNEYFGEEVWKEDRYTGRLECDFLSPFECDSDPLAADDEQQQWNVITKVVSKAYVYKTWGKTVEATNLGDVRLSEATKIFINNLFGGTKVDFHDKSSVVIRKLWRLPDSEYPDGQFAVVTDNHEVLYDSKKDKPKDENGADVSEDKGLPWGLAELKKLPFAKLDWKTVQGKYWGIPPVTSMRPLQRELNILWTQFNAFKNIYMFPPLLIPTDSGISENQSTNRPNEKIFYTPSMANERGGAPGYLQPPQFNWQYIEEIDMLKNQMSEMLGISGVSAGNAPKRVGSGRAISLLQSAGEARINPLQVNLEEGLAKFGKLCLQIIEKTYDLPRLISVVGNNRSREIKDFKGQMLKGNNNVTVELRSALPLNKQSAIDVVNTWTMNGIIPRGGDGQPTKEGRKMAVQMLNLESFNPLNASALLEEQAKWENALLDNMAKESMATEEQVPAMQVDPMTGAQIPTGGMQTIVNGMPRHPWDNDEVHIQVHRERQMEISYLKLIEENPEIEKNYEAHIAEHEEALVAKMNIPQPGQAPVLPQDTPMPNEQMPPMQMPGGDMPMEIPGMEDMQIPPELM